MIKACWKQNSRGSSVLFHFRQFLLNTGASRSNIWHGTYRILRPDSQVTILNTNPKQNTFTVFFHFNFLFHFFYSPLKHSALFCQSLISILSYLWQELSRINQSIFYWILLFLVHLCISGILQPWNQRLSEKDRFPILGK